MIHTEKINVVRISIWTLIITGLFVIKAVKKERKRRLILTIIMFLLIIALFIALFEVIP